MSGPTLIPAVDCRAFLGALDAVADGAADATATAAALAHAARCDRCRDRLAGAQAYRRRLAGVAARERAPESLRGAVAQLLREVRGSPTR